MEPHDPQLHRHPRFHRVVGTSTQALGWLTGDRHVEARGAAERTLEAKPPPDAVAAAEAEVLRGYDEANIRPGLRFPPGWWPVE